MAEATFSIKTGSYQAGSTLVLEGEQDSGAWAEITRISLDDIVKTTVDVPNAQSYADADGYINLRARWESESTSNDAQIYEITRLP